MGERVVQAVASTNNDIGQDSDTWVKKKGREWVDEGGKWAEKVGSRYGVFGFEKKTKEERENAHANSAASKGSDLSARIAGDAANAIVAYGLTKALLPVRVGFSLYLSPAFSRRVIEPIRILISLPFRKS